ncbi:carboxypeptidase O-like [Kryptolebias marmoratus]|uniref:Carboxypeptidase O n=1 Tax=Kryptolebias marmoratus TaxID=37003 RepID=A0A3Q3A1Q1_KRYMA|nr:carboxypeptidase O-like [Kryptolebias marmoratus]
MLKLVGFSLLVLFSSERPATVEGVYDYYKYHPMSEIGVWMVQMKEDHPDLVTRVEYGTTYEKRTISLLKIGLKTNAIKKIAWMDCGIHASEWIAPAFCQYFVNQILQSYKTDAKIRRMMENLDFYVTPVLNVDGYIYSWKDSTTRLWRKNRKPGPSTGCYGTDLDLNFDANWGNLGASFNCSSDTFCGTNPESESEVKAVADLVRKQRGNFLCFLSIQSFGQLILFPYGDPNDTVPNYNELMKVGQDAAEAIKKVHGQNYTVGSFPNVLYPDSGSIRDWARMQGIRFSYTFKLRDKGTFQLPEDQIQPACEEAYRGALRVITHAHDQIYGGGAAATAATLWTLLLAAGVTLM